MIHHFILTYDSETKQFNRDIEFEQDVFGSGSIYDPTVPIGGKINYFPEELPEHESVLNDLASAIVQSYIDLENSTDPAIVSLRESIFEWSETKETINDQSTNS